MGRRPTIQDLAVSAGVSVATVDRVLNKRHPVKEGTARRVLEAAERIGFYATGLLRQRLGKPIRAATFGFLLQKPDPFYQQLGQDLTTATRANADVQGKAIVEFLDELAPAPIAAKMLELGARVDVLGVVAVDHPHVNQALEELRAKGVRVFTLISDLTSPARSGYFGLDSRKSGRTAAWTISRLAREAGKIGILVGSHRYLCQQLAEISFRTYLRENAPEFQPLEPIVNLDDPRIAYEATLELLGRNRSLAGIYMAGGGMAGMIRALREEAGGRRIVTVCNELIPDTRAALIDGVVDLVIATPTAPLAERTIAAMAAARHGEGENAIAQVHLPASLYISENV
jgi:LacI family transcriptional regulator